MTEKELQSAIVDVLDAYGWRFAHFRPAQAQSGNWMTAMQGHIGYPDITAVKGVKILFIELKSEKGKVRPEQDDWLTDLADAYLGVHLVRPSNLDYFIDHLAGKNDGLETHWRNVRTPAQTTTV